MPKGRIVKLVLALAVFIAVAALIWRITTPQEPMYKGKPLSYWLDQANGEGKWTEQAGLDEVEAIHAAGTNAIPTLLVDLQAKDSPLMETVCDFLRKVHIKPPNHISAFKKHQQAEGGFFELGAEAKAAVPDLIEIYNRQVSLQSEHATLTCLNYLGPAASNAIPTIFGALTNSSSDIGGAAALALGGIQSEPDIIVPVLIALLDDYKGGLCVEAAMALQQFGPQAKAAMPALMVLLKNPGADKFARFHAYLAIQEIAPEEAEKIPPELLKGLE